MLGAEERPQWDEGVREKMIQILQLSDGQTRRSFRGLRKIENDKGETTDLLLYHHQLYDIVWRRLMCSEIGGAINADEPGSGKVCTLRRSRVTEPVDRFDFHIIRIQDR